MRARYVYTHTHTHTSSFLPKPLKFYSDFSSPCGIIEEIKLTPSCSFPQIKNFTLKNPTGSAVSVEIRTLSSYPAPLEALDLLTKWYVITRARAFCFINSAISDRTFP